MSDLDDNEREAPGGTAYVTYSDDGFVVMRGLGDERILVTWDDAQWMSKAIQELIEQEER